MAAAVIIEVPFSYEILWYLLLVDATIYESIIIITIINREKEKEHKWVPTFSSISSFIRQKCKKKNVYTKSLTVNLYIYIAVMCNVYVHVL